MLKILTYIAPVILLSFLLRAQERNSDNFQNQKFFKVDSILIIGNKTTKPDVILREMTFKPGDTVSIADLEFNRDRIYSLGIFTKVQIVPNVIDGKDYIIVAVEESWYIYPIPFVEFKDRDWSKLSYGMDLVVKNFRGLNETLRLRGAFGYDPSVYLMYDHPYFFRGSNTSLTASLFYQNSRNKSLYAAALYGENFDQKIIQGEVALTRHLGLFNKISVDAGYEYVETPRYVPGISASDGRIDHQFYAGAGYIHDTRDLAQYPKEGIYGLVNLQFKGLGLNGINYEVLNLDFREYRQFFSKLLLKWRVASRYTFGKVIPYYDFSFIGYNERIRGHYDQHLEGNATYIGSIELNYPIINDLNVSFDFVPLIPKELLSYRIALYLELFSDTGAAFLRGEPFSIKKFNSGYGAGLTLLLLPYSSVRMEYAVDENLNHEWIFGLGTSF